MADAEDAHGVVCEGEQDAVIAKAWPERAGQIAAKRIYVTRAGASKAKNHFEKDA